MFTKQPKPARCPGVNAWWLAAVVAIGGLLAAVVTIGGLLLSMKASPSRRVVVSFADEEEASAAWARHPLAGTAVIRPFGRTALILSAGGGVSNAELMMFYTHATATESDPMIEPLATLEHTQEGNGTGLVVINGGFATDMADAIARGCSLVQRPVILLEGVPQRGPCPSYLQAVIARGCSLMQEQEHDPEGVDGAAPYSFPSNCASQAQTQEVQGQRDAHEGRQQTIPSSTGKERADGALGAAEVSEDSPPLADNLQGVAQPVPETVGVHVLEDRVQVALMGVDAAMEHGEPEPIGHRGGKEERPIRRVREDVKAVIEPYQRRARVEGHKVGVHHIQASLALQLQDAPA
jgi:uncharacterized Zn-binding protein involved in type VI secretion